MEELLAPLRVVLRHSERGTQEAEEPVFAVDDWRVDLSKRRVFVRDQYLHVYRTRLRHKLESDPTRSQHLMLETGVGLRLKAD